MKFRYYLPYIIAYATVSVLFMATINKGFFWDTVQLASKHASHFYDTDFSNILLPDAIDSGHIPAFGMYHALVWKIFGRSTEASHLAMLPLVIGICIQLQLLISKFFRPENRGWVLLLVMLDPTLLSQLTLVSPDVSLVFFFLLGLNCIITDRRYLLSIAIAFLFLTSMRGMMVSVCLLFIDITRNIDFSGSFRKVFIQLLRRVVIYLPALFVFLSYNIYHYHVKGWIGFHDDSPWAPLFRKVGLKGIIYNIGILAWRIIDFGRLGIWLVFIILLIKLKGKIFKREGTGFFILLFLSLAILLPANMVWAINLMGHRYLLPVYLSFSLLCAYILFSEQIGNKLRKLLVLVWLVFITTGNLWVYPDKIAQGWDSTLAHLPYYKLRDRAIEYLENKDIDFSETQSFFPNNSLIDYFDLNNDYRQFRDFNNTGEYVIYSNVYNISDEEYDQVKNEYELIKRFRLATVYIEIRKRAGEEEPDP